MDVIFEPPRGKPFSIEVGFFDTVLEIKEKIEKYQNIPVHKQTLVFDGRVLQDNHDVEYCEILQNSRIQLHIAATDNPGPPQVVKAEESSPPLPPPSSSKIQVRLNINISSSSKAHVSLDMDANDSVLCLKERVHQELNHPTFPINRLALFLQSSGGELQDHRSLRDCEVVDNSEIVVNVRPSPAGSGAGSGGPTAAAGPKKLKLMVLTKCGTKKIPVEVNPSDNVGELRKELQKLHQKLNFDLPQEGYFFICKQNVMDDDRSFRWHHVNQGDTIEIFNGSVTGGS